jgi:hypothetical protein
MNQVKRSTVCLLTGHRWVKNGYPPASDGESAGFFVRCRRCGMEDHDTGTIAPGATGPAW